jgi:hypothetical protein
MSATAGKVALINGTAALSGECPPSGFADLVGYGASASCFEAAPTPNLSNTTAAVRADSGSQDTDNNSVDFAIGTPAPRNAAYDPLPVQLVSFAATILGTGEVRLDWATISEVNNLGFHVQRKTAEGDAFADLPGGFVAGHGTTLVRQEYFYLDKDIQPGRRHYRLKQVDLDGAIHYSQEIFTDGGVDGIARSTPTMVFLAQNYPNPFNSSTVIRYQVRTECQVDLRLFDALGREVAVLADGRMGEGSYEVRFNGDGLSSGVYLYRLTVADASTIARVQTKRLLIVR